MITIKKFKLIIEQKQQSIRRENEKALNKGNFILYQNNCNVLKGISLVMEQLKKVKT